MSETGGASTELKQNLGLLTATTLIMGSAIGSGIFLLPSYMLSLVESPALVVLAFVVCGLLSLAGALTFAEMAGMFPRAGGQYTFLREAFGDKPAFMYGWVYFWAVQAATIAAVATAFSIFLGLLVQYPAFDLGPLHFTPVLVQRLVAMACIAFLTLVNYLGVKYGGRVGDVFTILKIAAIAGIVAAVFLIGPRPASPITPFLPENASAGLIGAFGLAMVSALFAYDGWNQAAFVAGEVRNPQRTVPRAMLLGTAGVMIVYVAAVLAYFSVLRADEATGAATLAADVMSRVMGPTGATLVTIAIVISTFGTVNAFVLAGPRVFYAMAKDKLFYQGFGRVSQRFATPGFGLLIQAEAACLLVLSGTYNDLVNYSIFTIWIFYGVTAVGFFILRAKRPDHPRPYRTTGYPVVPALFIAAAAFIVVNTLVTDTRNALVGLVIVASGVPLAFWLTRAKPGADGASAPTPAERPLEASK